MRAPKVVGRGSSFRFGLFMDHARGRGRAAGYGPVGTMAYLEACARRFSSETPSLSLSSDADSKRASSFFSLYDMPTEAIRDLGYPCEIGSIWDACMPQLFDDGRGRRAAALAILLKSDRYEWLTVAVGLLGLLVAAGGAASLLSVDLGPFDDGIPAPLAIIFGALDFGVAAWGYISLRRMMGGWGSRLDDIMSRSFLTPGEAKEYMGRIRS